MGIFLWFKVIIFCQIQSNLFEIISQLKYQIKKIITVNPKNIPDFGAKKFLHHSNPRNSSLLLGTI